MASPNQITDTVKTDVTEVCIKPSKSPTACCQRVAIKLTRGVNACRLILSVSWRSSSSSCCCPARSASSSSLNLSSCASASPRRIQIYNTMDRWQSCMWCGGVTSGHVYVSQATCSNIYFYEKNWGKRDIPFSILVIFIPTTEEQGYCLVFWQVEPVPPSGEVSCQRHQSWHPLQSCHTTTWPTRPHCW